MRSVLVFSQILLGSTVLGLLMGAAPAPAPTWPQAASDIPADPSIRFGVLPTGMRYAIMKNATPKGEVSIRLRMGTGSLEESDAQQGLAHFLEHMAFRGSAHVADGEVFKTLERLACAPAPIPMRVPPRRKPSTSSTCRAPTMKP
jgi:zinc protease